MIVINQDLLTKNNNTKFSRFKTGLSRAAKWCKKSVLVAGLILSTGAMGCGEGAYQPSVGGRYDSGTYWIPRSDGDGIKTDTKSPCKNESPPKVTDPNGVLIKGEVVNSKGELIRGATATLVNQIIINDGTKDWGYSLNTILKKVSACDGSFYFGKSETANAMLKSYSTGQKNPYNFFIVIDSPGYLNAFIFDYNETPKQLDSNSSWNPGIMTLKVLGPLRKMVDDRFTIEYHDGQNDAALVAMQRIKENYSKVQGLLGVEPYLNYLRFTFKSISEGSGADMDVFRTPYNYGTIGGIYHPYLNKTEMAQINWQWNFYLSHEIAHHFTVDDLFFPPGRWAEEGLAVYIQRTVQEVDFDCKGPFFPIVREPGYGEVTNFYQSASCVFQLLAQNNPGFIKKLMKSMKTNNTACNTKNGYFIKTTLSGASGSDLSDFFVTKFGFNASLLDSENKCP